jgi:hypothetical protein
MTLTSASSSALPTTTSTAETTLTASASSTVDIDATTPPTVTTDQPTIVGKAAPNATIKIQVNSETQINDTVTANADGSFEFDLSEYAEGLEPGQHTVTITYTDQNGQEVTKQQTFYVNADGSATTQLALASTSPSPRSMSSSQTIAAASSSATPYGSGNPYPAGTATPSATPKASPKATDSGRVKVVATDSAVPVSGSVGTTLALLVGGVFFLFAGGWSLWIARALEDQPNV